MTEKELKDSFEAYFAKGNTEDMPYLMYTPPKAKYAEQDIFRTFDYIVMNAYGRTLYFQITTKPNAWLRRKRIEKFILENFLQVPDNFYLATYDVRTGLWEFENITCNTKHGTSTKRKRSKGRTSK